MMLVISPMVSLGACMPSTFGSGASAVLLSAVLINYKKKIKSIELKYKEKASQWLPYSRNVLIRVVFNGGLDYL